MTSTLATVVAGEAGACDPCGSENWNEMFAVVVANDVFAEVVTNDVFTDVIAAAGVATSDFSTIAGGSTGYLAMSSKLSFGTCLLDSALIDSVGESWAGWLSICVDWSEGGGQWNEVETGDCFALDKLVRGPIDVIITWLCEFGEGATHWRCERGVTLSFADLTAGVRESNK